jgi:hypothetical protein
VCRPADNRLNHEWMQGFRGSWPSTWIRLFVKSLRRFGVNIISGSISLNRNIVSKSHLRLDNVNDFILMGYNPVNECLLLDNKSDGQRQSLIAPRARSDNLSMSDRISKRAGPAFSLSNATILGRYSKRILSCAECGISCLPCCAFHPAQKGIHNLSI